MLGDWDPPTLPIGLVGHSFGAAGVGGKGITPHTHCVLAGDRVDGNPFGTATVEEDEEEEPDPACGSPGAGQVGWGGCMGLGGLYGAIWGWGAIWGCWEGLYRAGGAVWCWGGYGAGWGYGVGGVCMGLGGLYGEHKPALHWVPPALSCAQALGACRELGARTGSELFGGASPPPQWLRTLLFYLPRGRGPPHRAVRPRRTATCPPAAC